MNHQFEQQILDALKVLPAIQEAVSHIPYLMEQVQHIPALVEQGVEHGKQISVLMEQVIPGILEQVQHIPALVHKVNRLETRSSTFEDKMELQFEKFEERFDTKFEILSLKVDSSNKQMDHVNTKITHMQDQFKVFETDLAVLNSTTKKILDTTDRMEREIVTVRAQVASISELAVTVADHGERIQELEHKIG